MLNCLEMMEGQPERDDELLGLLREGLTRIQRITERLLRMSRETPLRLVETEMAQVIEEAIGLSSVRARDGNTVVPILDPVPTVMMDPDRFVEALSNIIDNALDASNRGDVVDVRCRHDRHAGTIELAVVDRGRGIEEAQLARVLDPFFSTKAIGEGSGLGLAITSEVVADHGFELSISSEIGSGTSVQISIPARTMVADHAH